MQQLGKYQLDTLLGQGGMGAVYRSFHPVLNRPVAVKVMLGSLAADPQAEQRFMREAQVVAGLSHPGIVNILDVDVSDGRPYIVMEYLAGGSLADRLRAGPMPIAQALQLAVPLADALDYAHRQGLVHRDLKPANVLLRPDGSPVLADFGLARLAQADSAAQITATGAVLGTLAYMAPEQFSGQPTDARADVYSFGVMLYELCTGRLPFNGDSAQLMYGHLQLPPPAPRLARPDLPEALERLLLAMLSKEPAWRPQSMAEVAAALRAIERGDAAVGPTIALARPAGNTQPLPRANRGLLIGLAIGGLALVGLLALGALLALAVWNRSSSQAAATIVAPAATARARPTTGEVDPSPASTPRPSAPPSPSATPPPPLNLVREPLLSNAQPAGPERFSIGGVSLRQDTDTLWFFGEVRNDADGPRESVQVRVLLRDADGNELASKSGFIELNYLAPGEIAPFSVLFTKDDQRPAFASYDFEVISKQADFQIGYSYRELQLADQPAARRDSLGFIKVSGRVKNVGQQAAKFVQIIGVFYDAEGHVVGIGSAFAEAPDERPLAAGADARFELSGIVFSAPPTRYRLLLEASRAT